MTPEALSASSAEDCGPSVPLFSVIIPTFDRPRLLADAVESVIGQTVKSFECIVVDDGGRAPLALPPDPRIRLIRRPHSGGVAVARNTGIEAAKGSYVTFLDDDDSYLPERLGDVLPALGRHPVVICWRNGGERILDGYVAGSILDELVPHLGQVTLRREITPKFDERFRASEDVEWWLRLAEDYPVTTVPRVGYHYRVHHGPRHGTGPSVRAAGLQYLLDLRSDYFATHPRARAFQWKQIGLAEMRQGNSRAATRAFAISFRHRPVPRTAWHFLRAIVGLVGRRQASQLPE